MSKYTPVWEYVQKNGGASCLLSFDTIQNIAGVPIDHSFLKYKSELAAYGYAVQKISMKSKTVLFTPTASDRPLVLYVHGKSGNAEESTHFRPLFQECDVCGFPYQATAPMEAATEFPALFNRLTANYTSVILIANSIGAYLSMSALPQPKIKTAYFISPVVNMDKMITDMMPLANISEEALKKAGTVITDFGETLSYAYLRYVRNHPICWTVPTHILYGAKDTLIHKDTITDFAKQHNASLTVMENGEHWFHTEAQMRFLDTWISQRKQALEKHD